MFPTLDSTSEVTLNLWSFCFRSSRARIHICNVTLRLEGSQDGAQDFVHARQMLYQQSYTLNP